MMAHDATAYSWRADLSFIEAGFAGFLNSLCTSVMGPSMRGHSINRKSNRPKTDGQGHRIRLTDTQRRKRDDCDRRYGRGRGHWYGHGHWRTVDQNQQFPGQILRLKIDFIDYKQQDNIKMWEIMHCIRAYKESTNMCQHYRMFFTQKNGRFFYPEKPTFRFQCAAPRVKTASRAQVSECGPRNLGYVSQTEESCWR